MTRSLQATDAYSIAEVREANLNDPESLKTTEEPHQRRHVLVREAALKLVAFLGEQRLKRAGATVVQKLFVLADAA